jgi:hypothetical protein
MRQAYLVTRTKERLEVARHMYRKRFPDEDVDTLTMQQLRGREGTRVSQTALPNPLTTHRRTLARARLQTGRTL